MAVGEADDAGAVVAADETTVADFGLAEVGPRPALRQEGFLVG